MRKSLIRLFTLGEDSISVDIGTGTRVGNTTKRGNVGLTRQSCNSALSVRYSFSACSMGRPRVLPTLGRRRSKSTSNAVLVVW
ncbi:hypothetical protein D3C79_854680 [compost metagenome]